MKNACHHLGKIPGAVLVCLLLFLQVGCSSKNNEISHPDEFYQVATDKTLEEVLDDAIFAITERNFRLTSHLHIGKAIRDRKNPDFPEYEVLLYCNLSYAQKMLEYDPDMINSCPGKITIRQNDQRVIITASLWPEQVKNHQLALQMQKMNSLTREIVDYAADDWLLVYDREPLNPE